MRHKIALWLLHFVGQCILFTVVLVSLFPYFEYNQGWPVALAYGSLLVTPLYLSRNNKPLFYCVCGCAAIWMASRLADIAAPGYIGHVTPFYLALFFFCLCLKQYTMAAFSFALSLYGLAMITLYGSLRVDMSYLQVLGWNLIYAAQLVYAGGKNLGRDDEPEVKSRPSTQHQEAA